jgi:hypothetical protein
MRWALLGNIVLQNVRSTDQLLVVSIEKDGRWFQLERLRFAPDYENRGPHKLAGFLGLPMEEVFPISYDISDIAVGLPEVVKGDIRPEPVESLSEEQFMALVFDRTEQEGKALGIPARERPKGKSAAPGDEGSVQPVG